MLNCTYENNGSNTFLVYKLDVNESIDTLSYGMLTNNNINGIIPMLMTQMNTDKFIKYNISSKITMKQYFEGIVNKEKILKVFLSITNAVLESENYMMDATYFYYDTDYIYINVSDSSAYLICFPVIPLKQNGNIFDFFKGIMISTQFDQTENTNYVAQIISFLNSGANLSLLEFKKILSLLLSNGEERMSQKPEDSAVQNKPIQNNAVQKAPIENNAARNIAAHNNKAAAPAKRTNTPPVQMNNNNMPNRPVSPYAAGAAPQNNMAVQNNKKADKKGLFGFGKKEKKANKSKANKGKVNQVLSPYDQDILKQNNNVNAAQTNPVQNNKAQNNNAVNFNNNINKNAPVNPAPANIQTHSVQIQDANFGETTVLGSYNDGETAVLSSINSPSDVNKKVKLPYLIRTKNNEKIPINKPSFRIGKEKSYVDYFIADNSYISRGHASIISRNGEYLLIDNNSRNHTYINGRQLVGSTEEKIASGDKITLANEEFEFIIE